MGILLAINGEDSDKIPGEFLLHRSASLRRISTGFTSGPARPWVHVSGREESMTESQTKQA